MKRWAGWSLVVLLGLMPLMSCAAPVSEEHAPVQVQIRSSTFGGVTYKAASAVAEIINKSKPSWLTAVNQESVGSAANVQAVAKLDAEQRKSTILVCADSTYYQAMTGSKPFTKSYKGEFLGVLYAGGAASCIVTLKPEIKTWQDLVGKRVALPPVGQGSTVRWQAILDKGWGILNKVEIKYLDQSAMGDALRDGLVDAMMGSSDCAGPTAAQPNDYWLELHSTKDLYYIGVSKETLDKVTNATGMPLPHVQMQPKALAKNQQEPLGMAMALPSCFWAWKDADEQIMYETVKKVAENANKLKDYLPPAACITREQTGQLPVTGEAEIHPGALKYFKEAGIKVGW